MPREKIIKDFAEWTAFSATRAGCPIKSRKDVYPLIRVPEYEKIFYGDRISCEEFEKWHETNTKAICQAENRLQIGWAAKLINIYLKSRVYLAREGRDGLIECIHPPIDNGLWRGIKQGYRNDNEIQKQINIFYGIGRIKNYEEYKKIMEICRLIAKKRKCFLIEVEELWQGTLIEPINSQNVSSQSLEKNITLIPFELLNRACKRVGNIPFKHRGIEITRELVEITIKILHSEPTKSLPQNARNSVMEKTPDGLDKRIKINLCTNLRTANIISDVLANVGIVEIISIKNPQTGRIVKVTKLRDEWC